MLACKQATQLASAALDRKLSVAEQIQLRLHLAICSGCRNFSRQIDLLRQISRRSTEQNDDET
jgi:predicted anti-sigma-YlaC factor YlaD